MTEQDNNNLPVVEGNSLPIPENTGSDKPKADAPDTKWFVLRVVSGKERKVKDYLDNEIRRSGWENQINQIMCPVENVVKVVGGKKTLREKIMYPGYLLVESSQSQLSDDVIQEIKNTTGVIHFLGKDHPTPLRKNEVSKMFGKLDELSELGAKLVDPFIVGEAIKITDGPFNEFVGTVDEVDEEKKKVKVIVKIFGKDTPVELSFYQVDKVI